MSCYFCDKCKNLIDGDYQGCNESPYSPYGNICDDCDMYLNEE